MVVNERNQFVWPGYDLRKVPDRDEFHFRVFAAPVLRSNSGGGADYRKRSKSDREHLRDRRDWIPESELWKFSLIPGAPVRLEFLLHKSVAETGVFTVIGAAASDPTETSRPWLAVLSDQC